MGEKDNARGGNARNFRPKCRIRRNKYPEKGNSQNGIKTRRPEKEAGSDHSRYGESSRQEGNNST